MKHRLCSIYGSIIALSTGMMYSKIALADDRVQVSGFTRIVAGYLNTDDAEFRGYKDDIQFSPSSLLGLQVNVQANENISLTAQGILRADSDKDSGLEWFYATLQPEDNLSFKVGKLRTPFFMHSDVLDVGYAYHWISPPPQMYNAFLFPTFEGVNATYGHFGEHYDVSFEAYLGQHSGDIDLNNTRTQYYVEVLGGFITEVKRENLTFRASIHQGDVDVSLPQLESLAAALKNYSMFNKTVDALSSQSQIDVMQFGVRYDNLNYFTASEWVKIKPNQKTFLPEIDTYYLTGGYAFDPVTVHVTYAKSKLRYSDFPSEVSDTLTNLPTSSPLYPGLSQAAYGLSTIENSRSSDSLNSWTIGARWDVKPRLALKADITFLHGNDGETAMFESIKDGFDRESQLYQVAMEWVF